MKALGRSVDYDSCPQGVTAYVSREQAQITPGIEYAVHALSIFDGITHLQVIDDLGHPSWKPAWLFDVSDNSLEEDWVCSVFQDGDPKVVIGPNFLAKNQAAYARMVELEAEQVKHFWDRLRQLEEKHP